MITEECSKREKSGALFRVLTFAVVLALIAGSLSFYSFAITLGGDVCVTEETEFPKKRSSVAVDLEGLKEVLKAGFVTCEGFIDVSGLSIECTNENLESVQNIIFYEIPEAFHVDCFYYYYSTSGYLKTVAPVYTCSAEEYLAMRKAYLNSSGKILKDIKGNSALSDVQKALLIHDRVIARCAYDTEFMYENKFNMYGALVDGHAVCQGYSEAYMYLLGEVGIKSELCISEALDHIWNIVYIEGVPYHVDLTWDDPVYDIAGRVSHINFLLSTDAIKADKYNYAGNPRRGHDANDFPDFPVDTTYDNYFWQNSEAEFQLVDGEIYYIDHSRGGIYRWEYSDNRVRAASREEDTFICSVDDRWYATKEHNSYWTGNFARLASDGKKYLFFSLADEIHAFDLTSGKDRVIYTSEDREGELGIYGLWVDGSYLVCEIYDTPNYDETTKAEHSYRISIEEFLALLGDVNGDGIINAVDVNILVRYISQGTGSIEFYNTDVCSDENIDSKDLNIIKRILSGTYVA